MNERIQQLAEQAGLKHHNWITNESNVKDGDFKYPRLEDYEKFAELIVRECMLCCERVISDPVPESVDTWLNGGTQCIAEIKLHFGVEE